MKKKLFVLGMVLGLLLGTLPAHAFDIYCPGDTNGDGISEDPNIICRHLAGGDGFATMADGYSIYIFGFNDLAGVPVSEVMSMGMLGANSPAPTLRFKEGQEMYLTLSNVGMLIRPDLFDPHTVHFHGFPNAGTIYDGVPDLSIAINMGSSLPYYYKAVEPGTYMFHCHVEVTEHMEMGMTGQAVIDPVQNGTQLTDPTNGKSYTAFAYNDGDGTTGYDVEKLLQVIDFDKAFHDADRDIQPLPFSSLKPSYPLLNGRGYPDTVSATAILNENGFAAQKLDSLITATAGQRILLRLSNLSTTNYHTIEVPGIPMKVVGTGAHILRGPGGTDLYYYTDSVTIGGGEAVDILLDTTGITPGTYYLYSRNLYDLNNNEEPRGGIMTEIVVQYPGKGGKNELQD
jgi:FtsP/CotA-like multicopper oxidase with cupredoxin domain